MGLASGNKIKRIEFYGIHMNKSDGENRTGHSQTFNKVDYRVFQRYEIDFENLVKVYQFFFMQQY